MRNLNVQISDEAYDAAKEGADRAGMLLKRWVERLILAGVDRKVAVARGDAPVKDLTYGPLEDV